MTPLTSASVKIGPKIYGRGVCRERPNRQGHVKMQKVLHLGDADVSNPLEVLIESWDAAGICECTDSSR